MKAFADSFFAILGIIAVLIMAIRASQASLARLFRRRRRKRYAIHHLMRVTPEELAAARREHPYLRGVPFYIAVTPEGGMLLWPDEDRSYQYCIELSG